MNNKKSDYQDRIDRLVIDGTAENTVKTYKAHEKYFKGWARISKGINSVTYPIDENLVLEFVLDHIEGLESSIDQKLVMEKIKTRPGKHSVSTIQAKLDGLGYFHKERNLQNPCRSEQIRQILTKAKNIESKAGRIKKQSLAITKPILERMIKQIDTKTLIGKRDKAILIFGFFTGGRRRSEISSAEFRFLNKTGTGYEYLLHRSKTDQAGKGSKKLLRRKHAEAITIWLKAADIQDGYLFRQLQGKTVKNSAITPTQINNMIKDYIDQIGEDTKRYSAHGLRRGFITYCARIGISLTDVMELTGHKDIRTALKYYEEGKINKNPATKI